MRSPTPFFAAALAVFISATAARTPFSGVKLGAAPPNVVPNAYILELESVSALSGSHRRGDIATPHQELYRRLEARGVAYDVRKEFSSDVFTGVSITLPSDQDLRAVAAIQGIKSFQPVGLWPRPAPVDLHVLSGLSDPRAPADSESTHKMTGVDKLHALGYTGKGVLVGVIDTGVDYTHPALGHGFGAGHKVAKGYDFVGDNYTGLNTPVPDSDPLDQCAGHGTHVAGIVAANPGNTYNISGVAYDATLAAYRVFGCTGSVSDDVLIEALTRAYKDGCDVITLSIGGPAGWTEYVVGVLASKIVDAGRIVTIASGNEGADGAWYASGPATGLNVISVSSVENSALSVQTIVTSTGYGPIQYNSLQPYALPAPFAYDTFYPIYALTTDTSVVGDGCSALPDSTPNLAGKIVLVRRGACTFVTKLENIAAKGGNMTFIYDNLVETPISPAVAPYFGLMINAADGAYLVGQFAAGANITVKIPSTGGGLNIVDASGGLMNAFSTWGPTNDMFFKPAVAAPGGNIVSTYPVPLGSYAILSGTSMATPFIAGSAALLFQKNGKTPSVARGAKSLFETTSHAIPQTNDNNTGTPSLQSLAQAGAGLINVFDALTVKTTISPAELLLNDTAHLNPVHFLTVKNGGAKSQTYTFEHFPAGTAGTYTSGNVQPLLTPVQTTDFATVRVVPSKITLRPGQSATVLVTITPPKTGDKSTFPIYSGLIQASGSLGESVHASYLGLNAKTSDLTVIDNTDYYFGETIPAVLDPNGDIQAPGTSYNLTGAGVPTLLYRLAAGSAAVYFDLVSANTTFKPTDTATRRRSESVDVFERSWWFPGGGFGGSGGSTFAKVPTVGPIAVYRYQVRNPDDTFANGGYNQGSFNTFANGTAIPKGSYKVLMRALKISGDAKSESSYESWLSTYFTIA